MSLPLENKVAIVTGGSRGIGKAIVLKLAELGAHVAFTYLSSKEQALAVENEVKQKGVQALAIQSDASDVQAGEALVEDVVKHFGRIDVCVNNAGIAKDNLLMRVSNEQWQQTIDTNLTSAFSVCKYVLKPMIKAGGGSIINMSSIIGVRGNPGQSAYAASKAGLIGFTKSLAQEVGSRNIRCNAIAPGFIETDMTASLHQGEHAEAFLKKIPLARFGRAEEVADLVGFLAMPSSAYITGQVISICGGLNI